MLESIDRQHVSLSRSLLLSMASVVTFSLSLASGLPGEIGMPNAQASDAGGLVPVDPPGTRPKPQAATPVVPDLPPVRISAPNDFTRFNTLLGTQFKAKVPGANVEMSSRGVDDALEAVQRGDVDIAVSDRPLTDQEISQGLAAVSIGGSLAYVYNSSKPSDTTQPFLDFVEAPANQSTIQHALSLVPPNPDSTSVAQEPETAPGANPAAEGGTPSNVTHSLEQNDPALASDSPINQESEPDISAPSSTNDSDIALVPSPGAGVTSPEGTGRSFPWGWLLVPLLGLPLLFWLRRGKSSKNSTPLEPEPRPETHSEFSPLASGSSSTALEPEADLGASPTPEHISTPTSSQEGSSPVTAPPVASPESGHRPKPISSSPGADSGVSDPTVRLHTPQHSSSASPPSRSTVPSSGDPSGSSTTVPLSPSPNISRPAYSQSSPNTPLDHPIGSEQPSKQQSSETGEPTELSSPSNFVSDSASGSEAPTSDSPESSSWVPPVETGTSEETAQVESNESIDQLSEDPSPEDLASDDSEHSGLGINPAIATTTGLAAGAIGLAAFNQENSSPTDEYLTPSTEQQAPTTDSHESTTVEEQAPTTDSHESTTVEEQAPATDSHESTTVEEQASNIISFPDNQESTDIEEQPTVVTDNQPTQDDEEVQPTEGNNLETNTNDDGNDSGDDATFASTPQTLLEDEATLESDDTDSVNMPWKEIGTGAAIAGFGLATTQAHQQDAVDAADEIGKTVETDEPEPLSFSARQPIIPQPSQHLWLTSPSPEDVTVERDMPVAQQSVPLPSTTSIPIPDTLHEGATDDDSHMNHLENHLLTVDSQTNTYVLDEHQLADRQLFDPNTVSLESGCYLISIESGHFSYWTDTPDVPGEPLAILRLYGGRFLNRKTNVETTSTWTTLNGYNDVLSLDVLEPTTLNAMFFDTDKENNSGQITLLILKDE